MPKYDPTARAEVMAMDAERIKELRALCEAATPGPWVQERYPPYGSKLAGRDGFQLVIAHARGDGTYDVVLMTERTCGVERTKWQGVDADWAFILSARSVVPELLDALEAANARAEKAEKDYAALLDDVGIAIGWLNLRDDEPDAIENAYAILVEVFAKYIKSRVQEVPE